MRFAQFPKYVVGLAPISLNSAAGTALTVDTLNYNYALCCVTFGVIGGAATVLKIQHSETDFSGADIGGNYTSVGTTGDGRLPQTTDAGKTFLFGLQLGGTVRRYLQCAVTTGATTLVCIQWQLWRPGETPSTSTERGVASAIFA